MNEAFWEQAISLIYVGSTFRWWPARLRETFRPTDLGKHGDPAVGTWDQRRRVKTGRQHRAAMQRSGQHCSQHRLEAEVFTSAPLAPRA